MLNICKYITIVFLVTGLTACSSNKTDPYKDMSAQEIYAKGKKSALKKHHSEAIKIFDALEARYPYGEYTDKAQLALIHAHNETGEHDTAIATANRFIRIHPRHQHVDYAQYMKGVINYQQNFSFIYQYLPIDRSKREPTLARQSFDDFKLLMHKYPDSIYIADARTRMIHLRNQLANHELHIANFYMQQEAYLAAANRAGLIVNQFGQTEAARPALKIMSEAYQKLGLYELAANVDRIIVANN